MIALDLVCDVYHALHAASAAHPYGVIRAAYDDYCQVVDAPLAFPDWLTMLAARADMPDAAERQQTRPHLPVLR